MLINYIMDILKKIGNYLRVNNIKKTGKKILYPFLSNVLGKAVDIGTKYRLPMYFYEDKINNALNFFHAGLHGEKDLSNYKPPTIYPNPNPGFGVGDKGAYDLAPSNIGDRQALLQNREKVIKDDIGIFRKTNKKMPINLFLPEKTKSKEKRKVKGKGKEKIPHYIANKKYSIDL